MVVEHLILQLYLNPLVFVSLVSSIMVNELINQYKLHLKYVDVTKKKKLKIRTNIRYSVLYNDDHVDVYHILSFMYPITKVFLSREFICDLRLVIYGPRYPQRFVSGSECRRYLLTLSFTS